MYMAFNPVKEILTVCGLKQRELAELLDVHLQRIKRLSAGSAKKLSREEGEALIRKLNVRAEWLATGDGPMFRSDSEQELGRRLDALSDATEKAQMPGLDTEAQTRVQMLLTGLEIGHADLVLQALNVLSADEQQLIEHYRQINPEGKKALRSTAAAFAKSAGGGSVGGDAESSGATRNQIFHGDVGQSVRVEGDFKQSGVTITGSKKK